MAEQAIQAPDGIDAAGARALVRGERRRRRAAARASSASPAGARTSPTRSPTPPAGAGRCAGRRSASASPRRTTWGASTGSSRRSRRPPVPVPPVAGLSEEARRTRSTSWTSSRARSCAPAPRPSVFRSGRAAGDRRARRRHARRDPRRRPRRGRLGELGKKEDYVARQLHRWQRPVGEVEDARAAAGRRGPRPARRPDPRAGPGDDRPRRLPARQHDPHRPRARSPRSSTGSSARSATRSPTSACCSSTGPSEGDELMPLFEPATMAPGFPTRDEVASRYAERSGRDLSRDRLLRRARALEAGDHPRGRLRPLRRRPVRQAGRGRGPPAVRADRRAPRRGRRRRRAPAGLSRQGTRREIGTKSARNRHETRAPRAHTRLTLGRCPAMTEQRPPPDPGTR